MHACNSPTPSSLKMASKSSSHESQSCCAEDLGDGQPSDSPGVPTAVQPSEIPHQEYDFVEEPPQEYFCPVTLELLRDPKQTECCGHHLSGEVVSRLQREGKPCPLCKDHNFTVTNDKFFKRKANELKVRCPHKRNGCEWVGELSNLDQHSNSCPKRPWQCEHCDYQGTYDVGTTDHLPNCTKYPEPCPNQCKIGTVPRCDMEKHLTQCPLQLVECEFAQAGCQERVPRQDLARHVEEGGQRHLLSMSLLNLSLTRELHQKMAKKDQQIAELQEQLQEQNSEMEKQIKDLQERTEKQLQTQLADLQQTVQQQAKQITGVHDQLKQKLTDQRKETKEQIAGVENQLKQKLTDQRKETKEQIAGVENQLKQKLTDQRKETKEQISGVQTLLQNENKTLQQQVQEQGKQIHDSLYVVTGLSPLMITLTKFSVHKASGWRGTWYSDPFYSHTGGYKFQLNIDTNGYGEAQGTHISAYLCRVDGEYDGNLFWPIQITAHLQLLNQRGDHRHVAASETFSKVTQGRLHKLIAQRFIAHSELGYNAAQDTQYLKNDCLYFRLYLRVDPPK